MGWGIISWAEHVRQVRETDNKVVDALSRNRIDMMLTCDHK